MDEDDRRLLERIQQGDGESFGVLYDRTREWLLRFVIVPRVGAVNAEDVLAETYRTALVRIREFEWRGVGLLHWLSAIARRKAQESTRETGRRESREFLFDDLFDPPAAAPTAEADLLARERLALLGDRVAKTLEKLPSRYREALSLRLLESRSRDECAGLLQVSTPTFDVLLHRASRAFAREWNAG